MSKSKIRRRIILLFVYNPNKEYYLSEIARTIGASSGTAQRELNRLLLADLASFKQRGRQKLYSLNKSYALLNEVGSIIKKTFGVELELKKALGKITAIQFAFLFGSYVKGGFKSDSDIDLFIIGPVDEDAVYQAVSEVEKTICRTINYHLSTASDFLKKLKDRYFYKEILKDHLLIKGDDYEFSRFIKPAN
ncbi:MAG: nucleotidyltransferase domain-containing protein [Candidatus Margulisiibacteriota bacterium]